MPLKIINLQEIDKARSLFKGKKTVLVGGCFDILHFGHFTFLKRAKAAGDFLIVILESDKFIKERKKKEPIHNQHQRGEILVALEIIDMVILLPYFISDAEYLNMVEKIKPSIIAVTCGDPLIEKKRKQATAVGGKLKIVSPLVEGFSTKKIYETFFSD